MAGESALQQNLSALLQWMISTNRVTVSGRSSLSAAAPGTAAAVQTAAPPAGPEEAASTATGANAAHTASALSLRFLEEWKAYGYPGRPSPIAAAAAAAGPKGKRPFDHSKPTRSLKADGPGRPSLLVAAASGPKGKRPFDHSKPTHSLYKTYASETATAVAPVQTAGRKGYGAAGAGSGSHEAEGKGVVTKKPRKSPMADRTPKSDLDSCEAPGCRHAARFGIPASSSPTHCARHATYTMVMTKPRKSCDVCTSRKVRCDSIRPTCGSCAAHRVTCRYSARLKSGPKSGFMAGRVGGRVSPKGTAATRKSLVGSLPLSGSAAAAAAVNALSAPRSATASTPVSRTSDSTTAGRGLGSGGGDVLECPRALAAHALTAFRAPGAGGDAAMLPVPAPIPAARASIEQDPADRSGGKAAASAAASGGGSSVPRAMGGDLGGLTHLARTQLASACPRFELTMLGVMPSGGSVLGEPATSPRPPPAVPSERQVFQTPGPRSPLRGWQAKRTLARPKQEQRLAEAAGPNKQLAGAMGDVAATSGSGGQLYVLHVASSTLPAACAQLSSAAAAAAGAAEEAEGGTFPAEEFPLESPSQGLNRLPLSPERQSAAGVVRRTSGIRASVLTGTSRSEGGGSSQNGGGRVDSKAPRRSCSGGGSRRSNVVSIAPKLRISCDRCTMRKIKCDGAAITCKRCEKDGQQCHYSLKRKSGPKPYSTRNVSKVKIPLRVAGIRPAMRAVHSSTPRATPPDRIRGFESPGTAAAAASANPAPRTPAPGAPATVSAAATSKSPAAGVTAATTPSTTTAASATSLEHALPPPPPEAQMSLARRG